MMKSKNICTTCILKRNEYHNKEKCAKKEQYLCKTHKINKGICKCVITTEANEGTIQRISSNILKINHAENSAIPSTNLVTEVIELMDEKNNPVKVLALYDTGNTNTGINNKTACEIYGHKDTDMTFLVDNFVTGSEVKRGNRRDIKIKTNEGIEQISVFGIQNLTQTYKEKEYMVPTDFIEKYKQIDMYAYELKFKV